MLAFSGRLDFNPYSDTLPTPDGGQFSFKIPEGCPAIPPSGWDIDDSIFQAPKADGSGVSINVNPESKRLELLEPFIRHIDAYRMHQRADRLVEL